eukprot:CAMPEP_0113943190 /NCGR_PEP_ID=MMETSP1339-20121228/20040_1 /TAXON_ID=94617 /ORGANISM="Fibrocapsa japonica" /LENGTH=101 /DNA_ID=CAMNT_0000947995 /DNA_START=149 /DNA_END=450 /DNA_ORIENTATION=+ /assembly_acc=CAM_ASM_000762
MQGLSEGYVISSLLVSWILQPELEWIPLITSPPRPMTQPEAACGTDRPICSWSPVPPSVFFDWKFSSTRETTSVTAVLTASGLPVHSSTLLDEPGKKARAA